MYSSLRASHNISLYVNPIWTHTHICASVSGVLHESNWDTAKLCRGVEQPWVCVQRSGRNMAGYTPLWKGTTCNGFWVLKGQPGFCFPFNVRFCLGRCELRNKRREMEIDNTFHSMVWLFQSIPNRASFWTAVVYFVLQLKVLKQLVKRSEKWVTCSSWIVHEVNQ